MSKQQEANTHSSVTNKREVAGLIFVDDLAVGETINKSKAVHYTPWRHLGRQKV
jgi:hypothetical protein